MNFHKTIGFLATLLLVLGLGVPDAQAQAVNPTAVTLSLNGTQGSDVEDPPTPVVTLADNIGTTVVTVAVTVTYSGDKEAGDTETVMVAVKEDGTTAEDTDYASQPTLPLSITATVAAGNLTQAVGSATIILTPVADTDTDAEDIVLEATVGTGNNAQTDEAILRLTDSEIGVSAIALTLNGVADGTGAASFADNAGSASVAVTVVVTFDAPGLPEDETRTVMVGLKADQGDDGAEAGDYSTTPSLPLTLTATGDGTGVTEVTVTTSIAVTPVTDDDTEDETVVLEATVENSAATGEASLTITDSDNSVTAIALSLNGTAGSDVEDPPTPAVTFADDSGANAVAVTVTLTLEENLAATETRTVMLSVKTGDETTAEDEDYSITPTLPVSITVTGDGTTTATGFTSIVVTPAEDADTDAEDIVFEAAVEGQTDEAILQITDTDTDYSATAIALSLNGIDGDNTPEAATTFLDNIGATLVAVTVSVTFANPIEEDETRTVVLDLKADQGDDAAEAGDYSTAPTLPVSITLTGDNTNPLVGSVNIALTPARDTDDDNENIVLEATIGDQTDEATLQITDSMVDPDPVAGAVTAVAFDPDMLSLTEGMAFTGTAAVTLTVDAGLAATHEVTLSVAEDVNGDGNMDADDLTALGIMSSTVTVSVAADATSGMADVAISYTPPEDDNSDGETITITGTVGTMSGDLTLNIADNDMGTVTSVEFSPATLELSEGMAFTGTVTVTVNAVAGPAQTVSVAFSSDTALPLGTINSPISVEIPLNQASGTGTADISYTPPEDDNSANEMIVITATGGGQSGDLTLNVTDNDAGAVTSVEFVPATLSLTEGMAFTGTATVTVNVVAGAAQDHEVALSVDSGMLSDIGIMSSTVTVSVAAGDPSGTADVAISYTPPTDADLDDEMITVTGMTGGQSGTLTLNVDDNTQSMGTITVSTSLESIRENSRTRNVVVTATLDAAPGAGNTVMVNIMVTGGTAPVSTQIAIADANTSNTATVAITPINDDVFTVQSFTVTGSVTGYETGTASIGIVDDDATIGEIKIAAAPPSVTVGSGSNTVNLTIDVIGQTDTPAGTVVTVSLSTDAGTLSADAVTVTLGKHPNQVPETYRTQTNDGGGVGTRGTATLTVDAGSTVGDVATVTATATDYVTATRTISALDRDAEDVHGYRVLVNKSNQWVPVGDKKVIVEIVRNDDLALPWTAFGSIRVSLYDTTTIWNDVETGETEVADALTASNIVDDDGAVSFTKAGTKGKISYVAATDRLKFELQISNNNTPRGNPAGNSDGQYLGVYAAADFVVGSSPDPTRLTNRQDDKPIYPNPTILANYVSNEADRYVGDGKIFWVDTVKPGNTAITAVDVRSGDEVGAAINATLDDEIRVAVGVSIGSGRARFDIAGIQAQLRTRANTAKSPDYMNGQTTVPSKERAVKTVINVDAVAVANASGDSLRGTVKVAAGLFKSQTSAFVEGIGKIDTPFEGDNLKAYVRARVKDQADNWSGWKDSAIFAADSRAPEVSILYPSAAPDSIYEHTHPLRFSGATASIVEGQNQDAHLNPLAILVDEDLDMLQVYAVGADTLTFMDSRGEIGTPGDSTAVYDTSDLSSPKKDGEAGTDDDKYEDTDYVPSSANRAGTEIELAVLATDILGNTTKVTISGVTHDAAQPEITDWFPKNSLLPEDQINDATPPIFTLPEDVDSIAVTFEGSNGSDVIKERGGVTTKGEESIDFSGALTDDTSYDMTIFVRDLAGNVFITPADSSSNMKFNAEFDNPVANRFSFSVAESDSAIAGQANMLTIQAEDYDAGSDSDRDALTYKNAVRISAWDTDGGAAESVWFEGTGVDDDADNPDGVAMLNAADWRIGKRTVAVKSNKATGAIKILVQHLDSGQDGTTVVGFDSAKDLYVGAADFAGFEITAWEEGVEGAAPEIWGDYTLRVVPVDRHGNASVRAFKADFDSLDVLDTRVKDNALEYKDGIDVEIVGVPAIEDFALLILSIGKEGASYDLVAPDNRRSQTVQVRVVNTALKEGDSRSQNIRASAKFKISAPLEPVLTLWVEGKEGDQAGNDVVVPATVTVAAEGYNAGDMVTFTQNGQNVGTIEANDEGVATAPPISVPVAGTAVVSASNGVYSTDELTITFVDAPAEPARKSYVDANGDPVYLISDADMTVGVDDFLALVAAFGSSDGDDNYNAQADVNDDGTVGVDDFLEFLGSWGRTAVGPATKPLVLAPGINENAEFSLSLGSERVVAGELVAVDVSLANVAALIGYGFALNYETDKFEFVSVTPADEDLLKSTGGETLFHHVVADGQVTVANGLYNGTAVSGGGDVVQFVFRVLREFEDNARFEIADGLVFDPSQLQNPAVVAGVLELQSTPREFALHQNFPNPFNPDTTIKYDLAESADVTLQIYNVLGQVVRTLVASEAQNAGRYQIRWNGMDDRGVPVSSGIYFYQISADGKFSDVRKLMLLK